MPAAARRCALSSQAAERGTAKPEVSELARERVAVRLRARSDEPAQRVTDAPGEPVAPPGQSFVPSIFVWMPGGA